MGGAMGHGLQEIGLKEAENRRADERLALAAEEMRRQQARADMKFRHERAIAAFKLGQLQRDNEIQDAQAQDAQIVAEALKNRILRGLPPGVAGPPATLGGGVPALLARPGAAGGGAVRPPDLLRGGGAYGPVPTAGQDPQIPDLTPAQALSGRDMSTAPSLFGGVVGNQIPNVMTDYDLQILDRLETPEAIQGFVQDIQARQDAAVLAWDRAYATAKIEKTRAYAQGSVDDEVIGGVLDGLRAKINAGSDPAAFSTVADEALVTLGEIEGKVETEFMWDAWMSYYARQREALMDPEAGWDTERQDALWESLQASHKAVRDKGADPRRHMLNIEQRERQMLMEGVARSNAALARVTGERDALKPIPISEVSEEDRAPLFQAAVEAYRQSGEDGVIAVAEQANVTFADREELARVMAAVQAQADVQAQAEPGPEQTQEEIQVDEAVRITEEVLSDVVSTAGEVSGLADYGRIADALGRHGDYILGEGTSEERKTFLHGLFRAVQRAPDVFLALPMRQPGLKVPQVLGRVLREYVPKLAAGSVTPKQAAAAVAKEVASWFTTRSQSGATL